jgi:cytochrome c biogenesis protein CcmG, thiol:disulfide interchange protein DsbE
MAMRSIILPLTHSAWTALIAGVLVLGSGFIWATRVTPQVSAPAARAMEAPASAEPAPIVGHPAPDFSLVTPEGSTVQLRSLVGQVVLVNVWATWCPPCRAEMPAIQATYKEYQDQGLTVLAVNLQEDPRTVADFMTQYGLSFPALLDTDGAVSTTYQARVLPSSFFVDRQGVVRAVYRGPMPRSVIDGTVAQLLAEAP